ncbi:YrhA family protein [Yersinia similis]|uniref:SMI1/KNR4 family protein n=1 Tax=Yersinia similis TaxID=367190 RepID=A0A0T9RSX2_9GAMM|nr:YrhA family protein [Yersinia similis]AHK18292.1 hypothetical protein BF17_02095 [Yersinia similis]CFQ56919.1 Uncharacterised protein [Yersinia similis]CNC67167.1 Uncharacterised protein [Yersinia similis]CNE88779.1 Uncharacterised protein [Yersinia similis]CNG68377.1 Uncharacterised protein [Yersinia similis]
MRNIVDDLSRVGKILGYMIHPKFTGHVEQHDFGRGIGAVQPDFGDQYLEFVSLMDGFIIDGYSVYGLSNYDEVHNELFEYNDEQTNILREAPELVVDEINYLIFIGSTGTDSFVYDVRTHKWEVRDRIAIDEAYESFDSLVEFLAAQLARIKADNDL